MKVLHTADWHLGRLFYGTHLLEDQAYALSQIYTIIEEEKVDAIIIAGDVFDRAVPPVEAVRLWDEFLTKVGEEYKIPLFVISGNHDSGQRLALGAQLLQEKGIHIRGQLTGCVEPVVLATQEGPVHVYMLPYHEPVELQDWLLQEGILTESTSGEESLEVYGAWRDYVKGRTPEGVPIIVVAHAFVAGGLESQSERALLVGGTEAVSPKVWKDFSYTALGHLHRPQRMGIDRIRYSGSLLPYSFDEVGYDKSVTIVELDGTGVTELRTVTIEPLHPVVVLEGPFEEIMRREDWHKSYENAYILVRLTDTTPVIDGMARLRQRFPHIRGLEIVRPPEVEREGAMTPRLEEKDETELFGEFVALVRGDALSEEESKYMERLWREVVEEE